MANGESTTSRAGFGERHPPKSAGYRFVEKNETVTDDNVMRPGPVLTRATRGNFRKGKRPRAVPSAAQVAEAMARAWGTGS